MRWIRNPPAASHIGGIWERQIRSAHAILSSFLLTHGNSLDKESLLTLVAETRNPKFTVINCGNHQRSY